MILRCPALTFAAALAAAPALAGPVTLSGDGRMGLHYDGARWNITSRIRITFTLAARTDGGLTFGGKVRADEAAAGARGAAGELFAEGAFGRLAMGDGDGAAALAVGHISGVGFTGLGDNHETLFYADAIGAADGDPQLVYSYRAGALALHASAFDGNAALPKRGIPGHAARARGLGLGAAWSGRAWGETLTLGIGYERIEGGGAARAQVLVGGALTIRGATVRGLYAREYGAPVDLIQYGVSVDYAVGPLTLTVLSRKNDFDGMPALHWYGFGASYDLGGGAEVKGGVIVDRTLGRADVVLADVGVSLTF